MELLLPVATPEMAFAAVRNGADAIYIGVPGWNARGRTEDMSMETIQEIIEFARIRGVCTFLAMNILIYDHEFKNMPEWLESLISLAPDAFIVQDIGLARLIRAIAPEQVLHASTQMTVTSAEAISLLSNLGFSRYVLARELSLKQIREIRDNTEAELEIFAHGALCISYSGECLTSENFGGRSANRGQCAQSCRLPYRLFVNEKEFPLHGKNYLFSPKDLSSVSFIDKIKDTGVQSLKIEGRLKSPEYVAATASAYRSAIDSEQISNIQKESLEILFSRGLSSGWLEGVNHQTLIEGYHSNHHGKFLGNILQVKKHSVLIKSKASVEPGDGILFDAPGTVPSGCRVYEVKEKEKLLEIFLDPHLDTRNLKPGISVFLNDAPRIENYWRKYVSGNEIEKRIPITFSFYGKIGEPLKLTINDYFQTIEIFSDFILEKSKTPKEQNKEIQKEFIFKELSSLSKTAYFPEKISIETDPYAFIHQKMVRQLKQKAVEKLNTRRALFKTPELDIGKGKLLIREISEKFKENHREKNNFPQTPQCSVLIREPGQIDLLQGLSIHSVIMDFDWGVHYEKPLEKIRSFGFQAGIATLRIHKPGETHYLKRILKLNPDFALVRNLGALAYLKEYDIPLQGDYSLNAANLLSAEWLLAQGLQSIHPSLDLNSEQLLHLLNSGTGEPFEIALHQYMPAFHMEHCLFAAHLTEAARFPECGKICLKNSIEVLDHKGERHYLQADAECRNTLFTGKPQSAFKLFPALREKGVFRFRLEMLQDHPQTVRKKTETALKLLKGEISPEEAIHETRAEEKYGVSEGQLFNTSQWKNRKKTSG